MSVRNPTKPFADSKCKNYRVKTFPLRKRFLMVLKKYLNLRFYRFLKRNSTQTLPDLVLVVTFAVCGSSFNFKTPFLRLLIYGSVL